MKKLLVILFYLFSLSGISQTVIDSYSESNYSGRQLAMWSGVNYTYQGQSFTCTNACTLGSAVMYMSRTGTPSGYAYAKIWAETHATAYGTDSKPTGSPLAISDGVVAATIMNLTTFTFSGANQISLAANTKYVVTFEYTAGDGLNYLYGRYDDTSPTASGNITYSKTGSTWSASASYDMCFYVYTTAGAAPVTPPKLMITY